MMFARSDVEDSPMADLANEPIELAFDIGEARANAVRTVAFE